VTASVGGQRSNFITFTYDAPIVKSISPSSGVLPSGGFPFCFFLPVSYLEVFSHNYSVMLTYQMEYVCQSGNFLIFTLDSRKWDRHNSALCFWNKHSSLFLGNLANYNMKFE
jgi:hypothetical protein